MESLGNTWFVMIWIFLSMLVLVLIFALRKEFKRDNPLRQAVYLSFTSLAIGALLAALTFTVLIGG